HESSPHSPLKRGYSKYWARSPVGTHTVVKTAKTSVISHSVIGAIHSSAVLHVVLKKPPNLN
ncbi:hypothetical protein BCV71DRAFT_286904, partial [Rhizopus microsporus]